MRAGRHTGLARISAESKLGNGLREREKGVGTMKAIQRIESGICVTIAALLATGWVLAIGELFAHTA